MAQKNIVPPPMKKSVLLKLKLMRLLSDGKRLGMSVLSLLLIGSSLSYLVVKAPQIHGQYLRNTVGSKVYMIKGHVKGGGGTGFAMKAKSGQSYIVTNSHVCEGALTQSEDKTSLIVMDDTGYQLRRKIIENSDFTDLCILEGLPGVEGMSMGSEPNLGDHSYIVGHPKLRPLSVSVGEIVGKQDIQILSYFLPGNPTLELLAPQMIKDLKCDLPKNELATMETMIGPLSICLNVTKGAYMTTIVIHPGNSGSPMVDMWGNIQGVAFASDDTSWGYVVSLSDLTKFLSRY